MPAVIEFQIYVGYETETGTYTADALSVVDNMGQRIEGENIKAVMAMVSKSVRKRALQNRRFPLPEPPPGAIIHPNGNGAPKLIIPPRN